MGNDFKPPVNETPSWRFYPDPLATAQHIEIAQAFWEMDADGNFTHTVVALSQRFGISSRWIREIQKRAGWMQPPFKTECRGDCPEQRYVSWIRFDSRLRFLRFARADWYCSPCIDRADKARAAEREADEKRRAVEMAERRKLLYARYGERAVGDCPKCKGVKIIRKGRNSGMFIGCSEYPSCDFTSPLPKAKPLTAAELQEIAEAKKMLESAPKCPSCSAPMLIRDGAARTGPSVIKSRHYTCQQQSPKSR